MIHIALLHPEIPPNTDNLIRLCANTGARLHLVEPLGFRLDEKSVQRAGLDYHELARVTRHASYEALRAALPKARVLGFSTRGGTRYDQVRYQSGDVLLFGAETRGLPPSVWDALPPDCQLRLPMRAGARSLNLANAAAIATYEAWRQRGFQDLEDSPI